METPQVQEDQTNDLLSNISRKAATALISLILLGSSVGGGVTGGVVSKFSQGKNEGITQNEADLRYVTKDFAEAKNALRERQFENVYKITLSREVYEAYREMDKAKDQAVQERLDSLDKKMDRILDRLDSR